MILVMMQEQSTVPVFCHLCALKLKQELGMTSLVTQTEHIKLV